MKESTRVWILQSAIDYVMDGTMPSDPFETEEEKTAFFSEVRDLQEYMDLVGPEAFSRTTFDVSYSYEDDEDEDEDDVF